MFNELYSIFIYGGAGGHYYESDDWLNFNHSRAYWVPKEECSGKTIVEKNKNRRSIKAKKNKILKMVKLVQLSGMSQKCENFFLEDIFGELTNAFTKKDGCFVVIFIFCGRCDDDYSTVIDCN